jgi:hypothetical protein
MAEETKQAEQPESRYLSGAGNDQVGRRVIKLRRGLTPSGPLKKPALGQTWPDSGVNLYYNSFTKERSESYDTYTYFYSKIKDGYFRSTIRSGLENTPIREKKGYLTAWEYVLGTQNTQKENTLPDWYSTKTDGTVDDEDYKWFLSTASLGIGWQLVTGGDGLWKNGIRSYRRYTSTVSETYYLLNKEEAEGVVNLIGTLSAPIDSHQLESAPDYWMMVSSTLSEEGAFYMVNAQYEYKAELNKDNELVGWDEDLY